VGKHYYIGIMSGTSLDGIDVALVAMPNNTISLLGALEMPFEPKLRRDILALCQTQTIALRDFGQICVRFQFCGRLCAST
jgi:anhydro-N-acetylmuramic acid kinase